MTTIKFSLMLAAGLAMLAVAPAAAAQARSPAAAPASGAVLRAQSMDALRLRFDEADLDKSGNLTEEEARRANFGFVAAHFSMIDTSKRGTVSFDEVIKFMQRTRRDPQVKQG